MSQLPGAPYDPNQQRAIDRRRRLAEALQGMQAPQAQMVGGHYVGPGPVGHLAAALAKVAGKRQEKRADSMQGELDAAKRQQTLAALSKLGGAQPPAGSLDALDNEQLQGVYGSAVAQQMTPAKPATTPSITEYEFAKQGGFEGSFQEWVSTGGGAQRDTADIQNWKFVQGLPEDQRREFMGLMRQPTAPQVVDIGGVPHLVDRLAGTVTPLASTGQVAQTHREVARAKGIGQMEGEAAGGVQKKGLDALPTLDALNLAEPLIDAATGSLAGAGRDMLAGALGVAPEGAQAIAQLKILQANLMTNMPRMEGPQSDRDVQLYREAAGQLGDPTIPRETKKAAVQMIRQLSQKYVQRAGMANSSPAGGNIDELLNQYAPVQ